MKLFFDIMVVLDVLAERTPWVETSGAALSLGWHDVEDAVQGISAQRIRADYLVTRNPGDFPALAVQVVTPMELGAILGSRPPT